MKLGKLDFLHFLDRGRKVFSHEKELKMSSTVVAELFSTRNKDFDNLFQEYGSYGKIINFSAEKNKSYSLFCQASHSLRTNHHNHYFQWTIIGPQLQLVQNKFQRSKSEPCAEGRKNSHQFHGILEVLSSNLTRKWLFIDVFCDENCL